MPEVAYLSQTGEIKIPLKLRTQLGLQAGEKFEVRVRDGNLVFVRSALPTHDQVATFIAWTKKNGNRQGPRKITIGGKASPRRVHATAKRLKKRGTKRIKVRTRRR